MRRQNATRRKAVREALQGPAAFHADRLQTGGNHPVWFYVVDQGDDARDHVDVGAGDEVLQRAFLEEEDLDLLVDLAVLGRVPVVLDLLEGDVEDVDEGDEDLLVGEVRAT